MSNDIEAHQLIQIAVIVAVGKFNPPIFQPEWFRNYKILPAQEIDAIENPIRIPMDLPQGLQVEEESFHVNSFSTSIRFKSLALDVTPQRLEMAARHPSDFDLLKQTTTKIFHLLPHTPVTSVGHNFIAHWKMADSGGAILRSRFLTPSINISDIFGNAYSVGGQFKFVRNGATVTLRVEESNRVKDGIYLNFNFNRAISNKKTDELDKLILHHFDEDLQEAREIAINFLGHPHTVLIRPKE